MGKVLLPLVILKLWTLRFFRVSAITCYVGYGQRGLEVKSSTRSLLDLIPTMLLFSSIRKDYLGCDIVH